MRRGRLLAVAALCALTLLGAACGDGGDGDESAGSGNQPAGSGDGPPTTTQEALEQEIVDAYEQSWRDFIRAGNPPDPEAEYLADHNAGENLTASRNLLQESAAEGIVTRGTYEFDAEVVEVAETTAVVEDCGLNRLEGVVASTGEVVDTSDDERDGMVAEMVLEDGSWKVTTLTRDQAVCEGA